MGTMFKTYCVISCALMSLSLLQTSAASPTHQKQQEPIELLSPVGDLLHNVFQHLDSLVRDVTDLVGNISKGLVEGAASFLKNLTSTVQSVVDGSLNIVHEAIKAKIRLLEKFRDFYLHRALTNAKYSLEKLEEAVIQAAYDTNQKVEDVLGQLYLEAQQVLNSTSDVIEEKAAQAKAVISAVVNSEFNQDGNIEECLLTELKSLRQLAEESVNRLNECVEHYVKVVDSDIITEMEGIMKESFGEVEPLIDELASCTNSLPDRPSIFQRIKALKCLEFVTRNIQMATSIITTDVKEKVDQILEKLLDNRTSLEGCGSESLDQVNLALEEINTNVQECLIH